MKLHWKLLCLIALLIVVTAVSTAVPLLWTMPDKAIDPGSLRSRQILVSLGTLFALLAVLLPLSARVLNHLILAPIRNMTELTQSPSVEKWLDGASPLWEPPRIHDLQTHRTDEVGLAVSGLVHLFESVKKIVEKIRQSGMKVRNFSSEVAVSAQRQESVFRTHVESTQSVLNSVEHIADVMQHLIKAMEKVAFLSENPDTTFDESSQTDLARMADAMLQMEKASKSISGKLEAINEKAENITMVVTTITRVAEQTNLLSLNAAIEAVKAGENGRGFTVVAREIRRLADQTAVATLDIGKMVKEMQSAVSSGVMEMDKFIAEVRQRTEDVKQFSAQLIQIIKEVQAVSPHFEDIHGRMIALSGGMQHTSEELRETCLAIDRLSDAARDLGYQAVNS